MSHNLVFVMHSFDDNLFTLYVIGKVTLSQCNVLRDHIGHNSCQIEKLTVHRMKLIPGLHFWICTSKFLCSLISVRRINECGSLMCRF